jgi:hypothetical protein
MKKKLTPEKDFSNEFDEAIEEDKKKRPEAYEDNTFTMSDFITGRLEFDEAKKKSAAAIGAKGGLSPKMNLLIIAALERYLSENPKASELPNTSISKRFCKKLKSSPIEVIVDGQRFEVSFHCDKSTERDLIISTLCERYDGKTAKDTVKSIACSTFISKYIPPVKKPFSTKNHNNQTSQDR